MKGLFFKIFGWFWLTIIITIAATYWISTNLFDDQDQQHHLEDLIDHYSQLTTEKLQTLDTAELSDWLNNQRLPKGLGITIGNPDGSFISSKRVPKWIITRLEQSKSLPSKIKMKQNNVVTSERKNVQLTVMLFPKKQYFGSGDDDHWAHNFNKRTPGWGVIRFAIALLISAIVCYLLARHFSKPIIKLRNAVNDLGKGNFETRVSGDFKKRNDEIAELASDFDGMASKLRDQFKHREELLRDISHELRSPLARMRVASELIKTKTKNMDLKEVTRIETEISLLDNLIGEILNFSKLSNENSTLELVEFTIQTLLTEIIEDANFEVKSQHKRVILNSQTKDLIQIRANRSIIQRAIENIIRNAINYTPAQSQVTVDLRAENSRVIIQISDQGPGVNENDLEKIFEPFFRVSQSRSRKSGGTGLGLAIAKRAIDIHGGQIHAINNTPAPGLTVMIELPLRIH